MTHTFTNRRCTLQFFLLRQIRCEYGNVTYSDRTGPGQVSQVPSKAHQTPRKMVKETHTWLIKNAFFVHIIALPHHSPSTTVTTRTTSTTMRMGDQDQDSGALLIIPKYTWLQANGHHIARSKEKQKQCGHCFHTPYPYPLPYTTGPSRYRGRCWRLMLRSHVARRPGGTDLKWSEGDSDEIW